jgi:multiple sugar transport system permease protein
VRKPDEHARRPIAGAFAAAAAIGFCLGPFAWQVLTALRPEAELTSRGLPSTLTLESFRAVLVGRPFARSLWNSLLVASATTLIAIVVGGAAAFAIAKLPLRSRRLVLALALATSMFPPIATVSPLFLVIRALGLRDQLAGLVLPSTGFALPLAIWILTDFFAALPDELYRAARVDGCSPAQVLLRVFAPVAAPPIATTAILVFVQTWNELLFALTFTSSPDRRTVPVAIALFAAEHREPWGEIAAASVIATLPLLVVTLLFHRRVVAGLTAGAVKG